MDEDRSFWILFFLGVYAIFRGRFEEVIFIFIAAILATLIDIKKVLKDRRDNDGWN